MKVLLGLGNPGAQYEATRHNVGWRVLDAVAERLRTSFVPGRGEYYEAVGRWRGSDVRLVKPTTYMNNSGTAARAVLGKYGVEAADMLVVVDELQFPLGRVQIKPGGSSGGHNGLESLIYHLRTETFPRLRCGIGNEFERGRMADYVLSPFAPEEQEELARMIEAGRDLALSWIAMGTARAMSLFNRTQAASAAKGEATAQKPPAERGIEPREGPGDESNSTQSR
jgi:PTH1 family peptidyl-tRNA hydrolase